MLVWRGQLACDDGNAVNTDGCSNTGTINAGYYCDKGTVGVADTCPEICGDGIKYYAASNRCDDGNNLPWDGCSPLCYIEPGVSTTFPPKTEICGDGIDLRTYWCDDGNLFNTDGCDSKCVIENGYVCEGGSIDFADTCVEICDDANDYHHYECEYGPGVNGDGCSTKCEIEAGFWCNTGMPGFPDTCWTWCGDGVTAGTEKCDDANGVNNAACWNIDGCSNCQVVTGWTCFYTSNYTKSHCKEICGDGYDYYHYGCDDGNLVAGDGCDGYCRVEIGYTCNHGNCNPASPSVCAEICGDGKDFHHYGCDDGNLINGDGCSSTCTVQTGWACAYGTPRS